MLVSHDPSEIIIIYWFAQETCLIIINDEKGVQLNILETIWLFRKKNYD